MRRLARAGVGEAAGRGDGEKLLNDDIDESAESEAAPSSATGAPLVQEDAAEGRASAAAAVEEDGAGEDGTAALQEDGTTKNSAGTASTATLAQDNEPSEDRAAGTLVEDRAAAAKSSAAHAAGKTAAAKNGAAAARERPKRRIQPAPPRSRPPPPPPLPPPPPVSIPCIPSACSPFLDSRPPLFVAFLLDFGSLSVVLILLRRVCISSSLGWSLLGCKARGRRDAAERRHQRDRRPGGRPIVRHRRAARARRRG